jgi:hypothetical protein
MVTDTTGQLVVEVDVKELVEMEEMVASAAVEEVVLLLELLQVLVVELLRIVVELVLRVVMVVMVELTQAQAVEVKV